MLPIRINRFWLVGQSSLTQALGISDDILRSAVRSQSVSRLEIRSLGSSFCSRSRAFLALPSVRQAHCSPPRCAAPSGSRATLVVPSPPRTKLHDRPTTKWACAIVVRVRLISGSRGLRRSALAGARSPPPASAKPPQLSATASSLSNSTVRRAKRTVSAISSFAAARSTGCGRLRHRRQIAILAPKFARKEDDMTRSVDVETVRLAAP